MKLVDFHKAQTNVGPHKKRTDPCAGRGRQIKLENWTLNLTMGLLQHSETWLAHAQQPALVNDRSFFEYHVLLIQQ